MYLLLHGSINLHQPDGVHMAAPNEKLAASLSILQGLQKDGGATFSRAN